MNLYPPNIVVLIQVIIHFIYLTIIHGSGGKYPPLSPAEVNNNCFSIYQTS